MEKLSGKHTSVWRDSVSTTSYPKVSAGITVDVAIIGGGLAGLNAGYQLKKRGKTVAIVEAEEIGTGVSGHTTAHITAEHNYIYDYLIETFGEEKAKIYADANTKAIQVLSDIIKTEKILCDFEPQAQYLIAEDIKELVKLKKEFSAAKKLGLPVTFDDGLDLPFKTAGSIKFSNQARFHPGKYMIALAKKIDGDGSYVFEHSRVVDVSESEPCVVKTEHGNITAHDVIVATNFPILDRGLFFARMTPMRSYVLGVYVKEKLNAMYDDSVEPFHYIRNQETDEGTLVLIGGEDHITGQKPDTYQCFADLESYARKHFTVKSIAYSWSSQDNYPFDKVPFIGKYTPLSKHLFVTTGYSGEGMTNSVLSSLILSDLILGTENKWESLYTPLRLKVTAELPKSMKAGMAIAKNHIETILTSGSDSTPEKLKTGEGKVISVNSKKVGVYKNEVGKIHAVSAICKHQGCGLAFNTAEKSWDCPCHGSRFDSNGKILHGPTVEPLPIVILD